MDKKIIYKTNDINNFIKFIINKNTSLNIKVEKEVEKIFYNIRTKGDTALFNYAKKFDRCNKWFSMDRSRW